MHVAKSQSKSYDKPLTTLLFENILISLVTDIYTNFGMFQFCWGQNSAINNAELGEPHKIPLFCFKYSEVQNIVQRAFPRPQMNIFPLKTILQFVMQSLNLNTCLLCKTPLLKNKQVVVEYLDMSTKY